MRGKPGIKLVTFLLLSLAVHLLVVLVMLTLWWRPARPAGDGAARSALEVDLVEPVQRTPSATSAAPQDEPVAAARPARPRPRARSAAPPAVAPSPQRSTLSLAMRSPSLDLGLSPERFVAREEQAQPRARRAERQATDREIKERLDRVLAAERARLDVQQGRVHPRLYDIKRDAESFFSPSWALARGDPHGLGSVGASVKEFVRGMGRKYVEALERRAATKTPGDACSAMGAFNDLLHADEGGRDVRLSCTVCITVGFGLEPQVAVLHGSGRRSFDELARQALLRATKRRTPAKDGDAVRACYRFVAKLQRVPPLPVIGGTFDETTLTGELFYPLKKILRTRVKLETVEALPGDRQS